MLQKPGEIMGRNISGLPLHRSHGDKQEISMYMRLFVTLGTVEGWPTSHNVFHGFIALGG